MRPNKARFISACQQMLVLGAVFAVLVPAADVISLDVITSAPREVIPAQPSAVPQGQNTASAPNSAPVTEGRQPVVAAAESPVETAPVDPVVTEHPMETAEAPAEDARPTGKAAPRRTTPAKPQPTTVVSDPEPVQGYGAVGVTWSSETEIGDDEISVEVRTSTDGVWSDWNEVDYHEEHGPDPTTLEGQSARPGTDALIVGEVDEVQARATTASGAPRPDDLRLAVVAPGESADLEEGAPAIDTAKLRQGEAESSAASADGVLETDQGAIALQATTVTEKPQIFSRAQWGADERLRDGSPSYYEVHAGFVHHTVNSNDYTKAQVPGIIRSIYAYHTKSRGWSDIGYNFLVDKFGQIWEGRAGGVDLPVVGAHTLNYNNYAFAMSAIGNFDIAKPGKKIVNAYGRLMAWKLSLHGVDASSAKQHVGTRNFPAINGHRDAASTACPGRHLYAKLAKIRKKAAKHQSDWSGRDLATNVVGSPEPDLLLRNTSGEVVAVPTGGMLRFEAPVVPAGVTSSYQRVVASPDLTGDGRADLVAIEAGGTHHTLPGTATAGFGAPVKAANRFGSMNHVTAVGDLNRDGRNDLVARDANGSLRFFAGKGNGAFKKGAALGDWAGYDLIAAAGDLTGDKLPDLLARDGSGKLWLFPGTGRAALGERRAVNLKWKSFDAITGWGDVDGDGRTDLIVRKRATGTVFVRPGNGNGTFQRSFGPLADLRGVTSVSTAPVAGTAQPALVALSGGKVRVYAHAGTRNVGAPVALGKAFTGSDVLLNVGDWDRDGHGDVITRNARGKLRLHRGLGNNAFARPKTIGTGFGSVNLLAAVGDVTGDGHPDLMGQPKGSAMRVYPGSGTGLKPSFVARSAVSGVTLLGAGRWDGDGAPDVLVRSGDALQMYQGNGPGGLTGSARTVSVNLKKYDLVMSPGDVNGDGRQDLVVRAKGKGTLWLLPGSSNAFGAPVLLATGFKNYDRAG